MRLVPLFALVAACAGKDASDTADSATDSTDTGESGESGETGESGESGETGETGETGEPHGLTERPANPTCLAPERPVSSTALSVHRVYSGVRFTNPVAIAQRPGDDTRFYVLEQGGRVKWFANDPKVTTTGSALDVAPLLSTEGINEDGLLGMAFHPDFATNGYLYLNYTAGALRDGDLHTVVARYHSDDGGDTFDPDSATILLTVDQPFQNHNGGHLAFGPDGYLYIGLGDGGSAGDPSGKGQDTSQLLGKMLRIDVDSPSDDRAYGIPADNPFADGAGGAPEIYAWGLRNPWRYSFDRATGDLWVGDVGQDAWEEISVVRLGGNYGWNAMEGAHCYTSGCDPSLYAAPVIEVGHDESETILGGFVYRGSAIPWLVGTYVFADSYRGNFWAITYDEVTGEAGHVSVAQVDGLYPSSMGEDQAGELYVVDWMGGGVYRIEPGDEPGPDTFPATLSATGCVDPTDPTQPAGGLIPYGVNMPLWSDGAEKHRWMAIPDGTTLHLGDDGRVEFPVGSVLMKEFQLGGRRVETRLLVLHDDGNWAGYSYAWREDGADADLLPGSASVVVGDQTWTYPSRSECLQCHTEVAGRTLGPRVEQLNGAFVYPNGVMDDQLATLDRIGLFDVSPGDPATLPAWPTLEAGDPDDQARAYLDANCAVCHVPDGPGGGPMDFRYTTALADMSACDVDPVNGTLGIDGAKVVSPGDPARSVVSARMYALDAHRMPKLGSAVVDEVGTALVDGWITRLTGCE